MVRTKKQPARGTRGQPVGGARGTAADRGGYFSWEPRLEGGFLLGFPVESRIGKRVNLSSKSLTWLAVASLAALIIGYLPFGAVSAEGPPRNVLLISIDTLRADHCGFLGYDKPTTPFLDKLAEQGAVFEHHMVHSNNTLLSHTTILTGLPPQAHDTYDNGAEPSQRKALGPGYRTLAEAFQAAGYTTASFTEHPVWLGTDFGLDQGFDVHESDWVLAPETSKRFLAWYDEARPERMFCFLHFYDVHSEPATGPAPPPAARRQASQCRVCHHRLDPTALWAEGPNPGWGRRAQ